MVPRILGPRPRILPRGRPAGPAWSRYFIYQAGQASQQVITAGSRYDILILIEKYDQDQPSRSYEYHGRHGIRSLIDHKVSTIVLLLYTLKCRPVASSQQQAAALHFLKKFPPKCARRCRRNHLESFLIIIIFLERDKNFVLGWSGNTRIHEFKITKKKRASLPLFD